MSSRKLLAALGLGLALQLAAPARAPAQGTDPLRIAVLGHLRGDDNGELLGYLDEVIAEVNRARPDVVVLTGDIVWGDVNNPDGTDVAAVRADWKATDAALAALTAETILRVPGNHDINDVPTRDLWRERYGDLPRSVDVRGVRLLLMSSAWIPEDDDPRKHPQNAIRGVPLDAGQIAFLDAELARGGYEHAFLFMHHMLWWEDWASWWDDVHPKLVGHGVRAVFAGDYGPLKFSHVARDGIDYVQSSIENDVSIGMLRMREPSRVLSTQLDNWVLVTVDGADARLDVRTVGALSTGKFSPQRFREVHEYDKGSFKRRLYRKIGWDPERLFSGTLLVGVAGAAGGMLSGLVLAALWSRRRRARAAR